MKKLVLIISMLVLHTILYSQLSIPGEIKFNNETYIKAYQAGDGDKTNRVTEYLKKGEDLETYEKMIAIWEYPQVKDTELFAKNIIKMHEAGYPSLPREVYLNDKAEYIVSIVMAEGNVAELNIFRIIKRNGYAVAYQYVNRNYDKQDSKEKKVWLDKVQAEKSNIIKEIMKLNVIK